ncbi:MAG TPA: hypothetical protein VK621_08675, partial [Bradyrhizobium sp.]|nr:hypothetical protein [Bradyrhizobium sp.]
WRKAIRHGRDRIRYPGVPQKPALCVFDQIAVVDEVHGLAFVDSGRPPRNIAGDAFTAIENIKFFDAGPPDAFPQRQHQLASVHDHRDAGDAAGHHAAGAARRIVLSGDAVHFKSNWDNRGVPANNFSKEQTLASMQKISDTLAKEKAQLWINHDKAQRDGLKMSPEFYD